MKIWWEYILKRKGTQPYTWEYPWSVRRTIYPWWYIHTTYRWNNVFISENSEERELNLSDRSVYKEATFQLLVIGAMYILERRAWPTSCYFNKDIDQLDLLEAKYVSSFTFEHNWVQSEIDTPEFWRIYTKVSPEQDYNTTPVWGYNGIYIDEAVKFIDRKKDEQCIKLQARQEKMIREWVFKAYKSTPCKDRQDPQYNTLLSSYTNTTMNTLQQEVFASYLKKHSKNIIKTTEEITEELEAIREDIKAMEEYECTLDRIKTNLEKAYNNQDKKALEESMAEAIDFLSDGVSTDA